jgi:TonB-dependent starch-binding outer membrane protein SusC
MENKFSDVLFPLRKRLLMIIMRTFIFLCCTLAFGFAPKLGFSQNAKIVIDADETLSVDQVFDLIKNQTDYTFIYKSDLFRDTPGVYLKKGTIKAHRLLEKSLSAGNFDYAFTEDKTIIVKKKPEIVQPSIPEQETTVTGIVTDNLGDPLPGASILEKGTTNGTQSDFDGNFSISIADENATLVISYLGFSTKEIAVNGQTNLTVILAEDAAGLEEVVVVGYGTQKSKDITGAIASVSSKKFNQGVVSSPGQLLQGKASGVRITSTSGEPGAPIKVAIRGNGSIRSGNGPLWVIDGVPIDSGAELPSGGTGTGSQTGKNPLNFLNPDDIANIDVLKDASATAIYGSRGSNGVILVTTKRGESGAAKITYGSYMSASSVAGKLNMLDATEFKSATDALAAREGVANTSIFDPNLNTDWQDELFRTAFSFNHNLSISGGTDKTQYRASMNYLDQKGIIETSSFERLSARVNLSSLTLNDKLKLDLNFTTSFNRDNAVPRGNSASENGELIISTLLANPTYPTHENGDFFNFPGASSLNPLELLDAKTDFTKTMRTLGNISATLEVAKGLSYKLNFGLDYQKSTRNEELAVNDLGGEVTPDGIVSISDIENSSQLIENTLTYDFDLNDDHDLKLLLGHSYQKFDTRRYSVQSQGFSTSELSAIDVPNIATVYDVNPLSGARIKSELQSFFGRATYAYKDRYLLNATLRADGSTKFGENNKYGYFPSFALGWKITEEDFMASSNFFQNLKLRAGWGQTGNQEIPVGVTSASFNTGTGQGYFIDGTSLTSGITFARTANEDLQWEVGVQTNVGLDFGVLGGQLYGSVDYFIKETTNQFVAVSTKAPSPTSTAWTNLDGSVENKGLDVSLGGIIVDNDDFQWTLDGNVSFINSEIKDMPFSLLTTGNLSGTGLSGAQVVGYINGEELGAFYVHKHLGYDADGNNIFEDVDGNGVINGDDRQVVGSGLPNLIYGINSYMQYKNMDFSFGITGVGGNQIYSNTRNAYFSTATLNGGLNVPDEIAAIEGESVSNSNATSSLFIEDGDFLRLSNATLGYNFKPSSIDWMESARVYVTGQNLFTITDYSGFDPEVDTPKGGSATAYGIDFANYPRARTFLIGFNVSF